MKTYRGMRTIDGLKVMVDGEPLDEHYDVKQFTSWGFEWTYMGAEPQQLALAILADHLGDDAYEKKLIGVTAADALLGKELVDAMTEKRGSPTLAGLDDKRPALTNAIDDFDEL